MRNLLDFLFRKKEVVVFLILMLLSFVLIVNNNVKYRSSYFSSSNVLSSLFLTLSNQIADYFHLQSINTQLVQENNHLKKELLKLKTSPDAFYDTQHQYGVIGAKIIDKTYLGNTNHLTIAAGSKAGVKVGMGVISSYGVVGIVRSVSRHFATIRSLLHPNLLISSKIKRTKTQCTTQWDQKDYAHSNIKYVPRHIKISKGDSIVTSGYSSVFPEDILIGLVSNYSLKKHMAFYEANIKLATDFTSLYYVFVIQNKLKQEKDSLQQL